MFELTLNDVFKSNAFYSQNECGEEQLRFDPPVYQQRYSTVLNILQLNQWKNQIKKVFHEILSYVKFPSIDFQYLYVPKQFIACILHLISGLYMHLPQNMQPIDGL